MKLRVTFLSMVAALVAAAGLSACSSSGGSGTTTSNTAAGSTSAGTTASTPASTGTGGAANPALCAKLQAAGTQLGGINNSATDPTKGYQEVLRAIVLLKTVKEGAPANVQKAVDELVQALQAATAGGKLDITKLATFGTQLAQDGQTITQYIASACTPH